jgi:hypothetical protein
MRAGALWNTMIMAFKTSTVLHWVSRLAPAFHQQFQEIYHAIGTAREADVIRDVYQCLTPSNFSKEFLEPMVKIYPSSLVALPVREILWSDWGTASRVREVIKKLGQFQRPSEYRSGNRISTVYKPFESFSLSELTMALPALQK